MYNLKKLTHVTEAGMQEHKLDNKGWGAVQEGLKYINDYCTSQGFKVLNVEKESLEYNIFIAKE